MTRNIWNDEHNGSENEPEYPIPVDPSSFSDKDPFDPANVRPTLTEEEIDQVKAKIAELEAEEELTATAEVMLNNLRVSLAALGQEG